ncbi:hypothetical protein ACSBR1_011640 [Camellia fascicularis]
MASLKLGLSPRGVGLVVKFLDSSLKVWIRVSITSCYGWFSTGWFKFIIFFNQQLRSYFSSNSDISKHSSYHEELEEEDRHDKEDWS